MGRRKRTVDIGQSPPAEAARADRAREPHGASIDGAENLPPQNSLRQLQPVAGRGSFTRFWLLLVAIVLETAWLAFLLVMVWRGW